LVAPYAVETILDELTMPTPVVRGGEVQFLEPMTPAGVVEFGDPVGPAETIYSIHSEEAEVDGVHVVPRRVLLTLLARLPRAEPSRATVGVHRIEATGPAGTAVVECVTRAVEGLGFGGGIASTACPPAVVAGMLCRGELDGRGVLPSELAVPFGPLFERLR